ncbi:MAG: class I SAM-dependent methyltransferase [Candidatus Ornithospirochaeta sp.]
MEEYLRKDFGKILKSQGLEARRWMKNTDSDVARVYDRCLEGLDLTVDIYSRYARIMDYGDCSRSEDEIAEIMDIVSRYLYIEKDKVIWKERKKREGREQHEKSEEECPVEVKENGLFFQCELKKYADTGLFLDQAETRRMVMEMARNQRVLNLFSYTSSFSVYAAKGGADSVESVDLSNVYATWSRTNLDRNGFLDREKYKVTTGDARVFLETACTEGRKYDIVIFDPPAFSNSHKAEDFDVQKDYMPFLAAIWKLLSDEGVVVFSENLQNFRFDKAKLEPWFEVKEITSEVSAVNFSKKKKSCRVWEMAKKPRKTRQYKYAGDRKEKEMSDEMKEMEAPERLVLNEEERKTEKRVKSAPRAFSFDDGETKEGSESGYREKKDFSRRDDRRDRRDGAKKDFSRRDDRREGRSYGERRSGRDERRSDRPSYRDDRRNDRPSYRSDRRDDRPSYRDDRRDGRFSDGRRDRFSDDRRRDRFSDDRRRDRFSDDRGYSRGYGREERSYDRYASDTRTYGGRRDSEGRRDNYKRDSYPQRDRRYSSDRDWDNDTSRAYRESRNDDRRDRRGSDREYGRREDRGERKKSGPKPYGYDAFMENKNREGATAFWLQGQLSEDDK